VLTVVCMFFLNVWTPQSTSCLRAYRFIQRPVPHCDPFRTSVLPERLGHARVSSIVCDLFNAVGLINRRRHKDVPGFVRKQMLLITCSGFTDAATTVERSAVLKNKYYVCVIS
jgi:hypothetical protein